MARKPGLVTRLRSGVSASSLKRLSPAQNIKAGYSRKARRYVLSKPDGSLPKITKRTPTFSARTQNTLRTQQEYGFAKPELATQARQHGALSYKTASAREAAAKGGETNLRKRTARQIREVVSAGGSIPSNSPDPKKHGSRLKLQWGDDAWIEDVIRRHNEYLAGDHSKRIPDGEWQKAIAILVYFNDPRAAYFRQSGTAFQVAA